jgi:hypothetical protein
MRVIGDVTFSVGVAALVYFIAGIRFGWSIQSNAKNADAGSSTAKLRGEAIRS